MSNVEVSVSRSEITLSDKIKKYVETYNPTVYILTPCFASLCYVTYVDGLMRTIDLFKVFNVNLHVHFCRNDSLVSRARNNLVAKAMSDPKMTHIMFIDNDITWNPYDILKLMISDKHIIGGAYPLKQYKWDKIANDTNQVSTWIDKKNNNSVLKDTIDNSNMIQYNLVNYNINYLSNNLQIEENVASVKHLATGFMMIKRTVIEKMQQAFPSTKYTDDVGFLHDKENDHAYALFDCGVEDGHYMSEDWLFCQRWTKMGGNISLDVSINLNHTGVEEFSGSYIASIL
jgi:hypothetical protein